MHLATYLGLLHRAETDLADGFRQVAEGHAAEPDVYHLCHTLAKQCEAHVEMIKPFAERYGEESPEEPDRLRHDFFDNGTREGGLGLLRDMQDLFMMAQEVQISQSMIGQAAEGLRDLEMDSAIDDCAERTSTQIKWLRTRMKQAAPQTLLVAP